MTRVLENKGIYVPPGFVLERHIFFAIDNVDFQEDTPSGKLSLHGTAMAIYQQLVAGDGPIEYLKLLPDRLTSLIKVPEIFTPLLLCNMPKKPGPLQPIYQPSLLPIPEEIYKEYRQFERNTFLSKVVLRNRLENKLELISTEDILKASSIEALPIVVVEPVSTCKIHSWSSLNSLIIDHRPLTRVGCPPLIAAPAHEFQTLLTVLKQAQGINSSR